MTASTSSVDERPLGNALAAANSSTRVDDSTLGDSALKAQQNGVGTVMGEYQCYFQGAKGRLYAGTNALYFLGMMFFFAREMNVKWMDVVKVVKAGNDGITIVTRETKYDFSGFSTKEIDRIWANLVSLHSEALHGGSSPRKGGGGDDVSPLISPRSMLRRMNSDPTSEMRQSLAPNQPTGSEGFYVAAASVAQLQDVRASTLKTHQLPPYKSMRKPPMNMSILAETEDLPRYTSMRGIIATSPSKDESVDAVQDLGEAWAQLQESTDEVYAECAVKDHEISCNMQEFIDMFLADTAKHSIATFMESMGDEDLEVSSWEPEEDGTLFERRRVEYSHPVNAPLAPPMARARKEQRYRKFGDHGITIESDTYVQDVPMADCFYVTDRILVEPKGDGKKLHVTAEFDIRFIKSTMFRAIITNTTRSEFVKWFDAMFEFMSQVAEGRAPEEIEAARRKPEIVPPVAPPLGFAAIPLTSTHVMILLLLVVLFLQAWIMFQMRTMQRSMLTMQTSMMQTCPALSEPLNF